MPENGPGRAEIVIEQMRHAGLFPLSDRPEFNVDGQPLTEDRLTAGAPLVMHAPAGEVYYTLDGSDPWESHPTVEYTSLIGPTVPARVIVPQNESLQSNWRQLGFDDSELDRRTNGDRLRLDRAS